MNNMISRLWHWALGSEAPKKTFEDWLLHRAASIRVLALPARSMICWKWKWSSFVNLINLDMEACELQCLPPEPLPKSIQRLGLNRCGFNGDTFRHLTKDLFGLKSLSLNMSEGVDLPLHKSDSVLLSMDIIQAKLDTKTVESVELAASVMGFGSREDCLKELMQAELFARPAVLANPDPLTTMRAV
jgi:hypothetical protein